MLTRILLTATALLLLPATAFAQDGTWLTDGASKCRLWWPNESLGPGDTYAYSALHWTGPCRNGVANGHGGFEFAVVWRYVAGPPIPPQAPVAYTQSGEGDFVQGKLTGKGFTVRTNPTRTYRREGDFRDGMLNGKGVQSNQGPDRFSRSEGTFVNDKLNGPGSSNNESWPDSTRERAYIFRYEGDYVNGEQNGRGVYVRGRKGCTAQIKYEGEYRGGRPNGRGTFTTKDGRPHPGMFEDGQLVGTNIDMFTQVIDIDKSCP